MRTRYWLFPLLVALLVLGHACDLPAYAALLASHDEVAEEETASATHDHEGDEALTCDGAVVVPSPSVIHGAPVLVATMVTVPTAAWSLAGVASVLDRVPKSSTDPPLFLLFSSLLI